jgi:DNA-binding MltR family transcriptional regulator
MKRPVIQIEQLSAETRQLYHVLNEEPDLACVVIGAAFLDAAVASLLAQRFSRSKVTEKLLAPIGALGSFAVRADVAYALGLIKEAHHHDLCVVGQIRNAFAHSHLNLSFQDANIRQICNRLNEWRVLVVEADEVAVKPTDEQLRARARNQFNLSVIMLSNRLLVHALSLKAQSQV